MFNDVDLEGGAKYKGEMVNGKREGKGINKWENGDKYIGTFENGIMQGEGELIKASGT